MTQDEIKAEIARLQYMLKQTTASEVSKNLSFMYNISARAVGNSGYIAREIIIKKYRDEFAGLCAEIDANNSPFVNRHLSDAKIICKAKNELIDLHADEFRIILESMIKAIPQEYMDILKKYNEG